MGSSGPVIVPIQTEVGSVALPPQEALVSTFGFTFTGNEADRVKKSFAAKGFKGDITIPFVYDGVDGSRYMTAVRYKLEHESLTLLERDMK